MINYIIENKEQLFGVVTAVIAAASAIAALTPTPKDDTFVGKAYKVIKIMRSEGSRATAERTYTSPIGRLKVPVDSDPN